MKETWHGKTVQWGDRHTDVIELLPASLDAVDMAADNPGTWLFHCQVSDHMEAGMMASFTIYRPQHCSSPLQITSADFWHAPGKFLVTVKNTSSKPTSSVFVDFDHLMTRQYRRRPWMNEWKWDTAIQPGQEQTFEMIGYRQDRANAVLGWVLFPKRVIFQDGSRWPSSQPEQCFHVFWRDQEQPSLEVLPPLFVEMNED